jgi:hypothetical protein
MAQKLITKPIIDALAKTPYRSTEKVAPDDKKVIARFFGGCACTWYVLEDDSFFKDYKLDEKTGLLVPTSLDADHIEPNMTVFGAVTLGHGLELGPFSLKEISSIHFPPFGLGLERDIMVTPLKETLGELRKCYGEEWM